MNHPRTGPASEIINRMSALLLCRPGAEAPASPRVWEHRPRRWEHSDGRMCFQLFPDIQTGRQVEEEIFELVGSAQRCATLIDVTSRQLFFCSAEFADQT